MHVHGGGPSICREELDINSMECIPEQDLMLEELKGQDSTGREFSRRISRQFVDDCRGDLELYKRKYGGVDDMSVDAFVGQDASKDDMDIGDEDSPHRREELGERVRKLSADIEVTRRKKAAQSQDHERQVIAMRDTRHAGDPEEHSKMLHQRLDQLEREFLAEQRSVEENILAKEEELRRSRLELQKLEHNTQLHARQA